MFTINDKKYLNLPEKVEANAEDISDLKTSLDSKQDTGTAVNDTNLNSKIEAIDTLALKSVSTDNLTNTGTLEQEGKATFGGDVEVDGSVTLNAPTDVKFKTGHLNFSELYDFIDQYYNEAYNLRLANQSLNPYTISGDLSETFPNLCDATSILGFMLGFKPTVDGIYTSVTLPAFTKGPVDANHAFEGIYSVKTINFSGGTLWRVYSLAGGSTYVERILTSGTTYIMNADGLGINIQNLVEIGSFDMSQCIVIGSFISGSAKVKSIHCTHFKVSFDISASTAFEESDLVEIIGNLDPVTTAQTLTMGATNLAKLTQDEILVATGKGWTLA